MALYVHVGLKPDGILASLKIRQLSNKPIPTEANWLMLHVKP